jgi:hypothetical protein
MQLRWVSSLKGQSGQPAACGAWPKFRWCGQQHLNGRDETSEDLKARLAAAEARMVPLFDLKRDSIDSIADTIARTISPSRAEKIARGILGSLKEAKPAGWKSCRFAATAWAHGHGRSRTQRRRAIIHVINDDRS